MSVDIPNGVLEAVFEKILRGNEVTRILTVCRRWYDIGSRLLWQEIVLRNGDAMLRLSSIAESPCFLLIRPLTVTLPLFEPELVPHPTTYLLAEGMEYVEKYGNKDTRELGTRRPRYRLTALAIVKPFS